LPPVQDTTIPKEIQPVNTTSTPEKKLVAPTSIKATYYTINITAFGWYNIDILLKEYSKCVPSELFVRLQGGFKAEASVVLVIPSVKAFVEGGKLDDDKQYGFDETNGKIPLPPGARCYVLAFAEFNGKIIFGKTEFNAKENQVIDVSITETTKDQMMAKIKQLDLDGISAEVKNIRPPDPVKTEAYEKKMSEAQKLKPVGCDCGFPNK
jgi:hypothetical protein